MDKTLEIVIAASVILMTAASIMFMVSDRAGSFGQWSNDTQTGAECSLKKAQFENACNCPTTNTPQKARNLRDEAEAIDGCTWPDSGSGSGGYGCDDYCN